MAIVFIGIPALIRLAIFVGDLRSSYTPVESEDVLAPGSPQLKPLGEATNSAQVNLQGFAEPGAMVEIFLNDMIGEEIVVETDGTFSVNNFKIEAGENEIYAVATDQAGNQSQSSAKLFVSYDIEPPELTIEEPAGESLTTSEEKIEIKGQVEPQATLTVNGRFVIINPEGKFNYSVNLEEGENKIEIIALDKAGNETKKEIIIKRE